MEKENLYQEDSACGNPYRSAYHDNLEMLLCHLKERADENRQALHDMIRSRPEKYRNLVRRLLGWPLTEANANAVAVKKEFVASDSLADIYRLQMEIQPGVRMYGILFLHHAGEPLPLVIAQHGGFGTPELCSGFFNSANYHNMSRRILRKGVHVFCPQLFLWHSQLFGDRPYDRRRFDDELKRLGSSITAIEVDGLQKYLNYFQTFPQILPDKIGMIGLSYGGFYSLLTAALDVRIRAVMTACFFNCAEAHVEFSDCAWSNSQNCFQDAEIAALLYPRKLWIEVADQDELFSPKSAAKEYERLQGIYKGAWPGLNFRIFRGVHEFPIDDDGIEFVVRSLWNNSYEK